MAASHTAHLHEIRALDRAKLVCRLLERRRVGEDGCWTLKGAPLQSGHIQLTLGSPSNPPYYRVRAHVFAWEVLHNQEAPAGRVVMHKCDTPSCVNPDHLTLGTQGDNVRDSVQKGRHGRWHATGRRLDGRRPNVPYLPPDVEDGSR